MSHRTASTAGFRLLRHLESLRPRTRDELHRFVHVLLGLSVPRRAIIDGNTPPFEYLVATFFEGQDSSSLPSAPGSAGGFPSPSITQTKNPPAEPGAEGGGLTDIIVWAARGSGKTHLGAVATLLDMLFKPGIQVRILAGSMQQSSRMYTHLVRMLSGPLLRGVLADEPTLRRVVMLNGSEAELLAQSETSVRGTRVHKLRCDEVELFEPAVWQAAQLVTRSGWCGDTYVRGTVEAMSTMHLPFGLMSRLIGGMESKGDLLFPSPPGRGQGEGLSSSSSCPAAPNENEEKTLTLPSPGGRGEEEDIAARPSPLNSSSRLFRWCALDVIARCPAELPCETCKLEPDCQGRAKTASGFVPVEDLIAERKRVSGPTWDAEMMCRRPVRSHSVYESFDREKHVGGVSRGGGKSVLLGALKCEESELPFIGRQRRDFNPETVPAHEPESYTWLAGMDFGIRSPLVMLWARLGEPWDAPPHDRVLEVVDEYLEKGLTMERHLRRIERRGWPRPEWIGVDPAGGQRNSQTGVSNIDLLRSSGYKIRRMKSRIAPGIDLIRRRLDHGLLRIEAGCESLIKGLVEYHFNENRPQDANPVKDGPDHICDALRYLVVNLDLSSYQMRGRGY